MINTLLLQGYRQQLASRPSKVAFVLDGQAFTFADLQARATVLQQTFAERRQLRVAIALPNCLDVACWYIACASAGHTLILMEPEWPQATYKAALQLVRPNIIAGGPGAGIECDFSAAAGNPDWYDETNFAFLAGFTSGSSGRPKAFLRDSNSWLASFRCSSREFDISAETVQLAPGPLSHGLSFYAMAESLYAGATFVTQSNFSAEACITTLQTSANSLVVVPTMLQRILDSYSKELNGSCDQRHDGAGSELKFKAIVAGAKLSSHLKQRFRATWPAAQLSEYYGASELSFVSVNHDHEDLPDDSVGRLCEGVSVTTFDSSGLRLPASTAGTLHVRSAMLASGYLKQQSGAFIIAPLSGTDGWYTVGDRGHLDAQGNLFLTDREDRMLISGGLNVYPSSVERIISEELHNRGFGENLEHCVVLGIPDPEWGEKIVLILAGNKLQPDSVYSADSADFAGIRQTLAGCFAGCLQKHEIPRLLFVAETIPLTTSGKVAYRELQQLLPELTQLII